MAEFILVIWATIAVNGGTISQDWRPIGDFKTAESCQAAAAMLNYRDAQRPYICLRK